MTQTVTVVSSWWDHVKNNIPFQCGLLFLFVLISFGHPVPEPVTEYLYLPCLAKQYNPQYILNDWTMASPWYEHAVFNVSVGWLTLFLPLEIVGWLGRVVSWILLIVLLHRIGKHLELPAWMTSFAIVLWLLRDQSIVASEWVFGGFEAKVVSYVFLFAALSLFLQQRDRWGALCLGLCFSFHAAVGMWAGLAVGASLVLLRTPVRQLFPLAGLVMVGSLPGLVAILLLLSHSEANSVAAWKFVVTVQAHQHFDPASWPQRDIVLLFVLFTFNALYALSSWHQRSVRFLFFVQVALGFFFVVGLWWRWQEAYHLLRYFPFRLFPVFGLLCFWLQMMMLLQRILHISPDAVNPPRLQETENAPTEVARSSRTMTSFLRHLFSTTSYKTTIALSDRDSVFSPSESVAPMQNLPRLTLFVGLIGLMGLGNPVAQCIDRINETRRLWKPKRDDVFQTLRWVRNHTPVGSIVIQPPWIGDTFYVSRRAQIANWWANRYDKLPEWIARLEALVGKIPPFPKTQKQSLLEPKQALLEQNYNSRTPEQIRFLVKRYGGQYLISKGHYPYPVLFKTATYRVYELKGLASP